MANTGDAHTLEIVVQQGHEGLTNNLILCKAQKGQSVHPLKGPSMSR